MICLVIDGLTGIKFMWATIDVHAALLVTTIFIIKQQRRVTRWEAAIGTNIGHRTNDGVGR